MLRFPVAVSVALLLAVLFRVSHGISVNQVNSTYIYADSKFYRVALSHQDLTLFYRDTAGSIPGDRVTLLFSSFEERYRYGFGPFASGPNALFTTVCKDVAYESEYRFKSVSWESGPQDSVILQSRVEFGKVGSNCSLIRQFYVSDNDVNLIVAGKNVSFHPYQVKFSMLIDCPWKPQLAHLIGSPPDQELYIWGRQHKSPFSIEMSFTSSFTLLPVPILVDEGRNFPSWMDYTARQCAQTNTTLGTNEIETPGRPLVSTFNFDQTGGLLVRSEQYDTGILFLPWARSDEKLFTRASCRVDDATFDPSRNYFSAIGNVTFEFFNFLEYDPTLQLLLLSDPRVERNTSPFSPTATNDELDASTGNAAIIAAAVSVPVAVVAVAVASIVGYVLVRRKRMRQQQLIVKKLRDADEKPQLKAQEARSASKSGAWVAASPS